MNEIFFTYFDRLPCARFIVFFPFFAQTKNRLFIGTFDIQYSCQSSFLRLFGHGPSSQNSAERRKIKYDAHLQTKHCQYIVLGPILVGVINAVLWSQTPNIH